jgi:hypothetical protein
MAKKKSRKHAQGGHERPADVGHPGRFPTREEFRREEEKEGMPPHERFDEIAARLERHLVEQFQDPHFMKAMDGLFEPRPKADVSDIVAERPGWSSVAVLLRPWMHALIKALSRPRLDHRQLSPDDRNRFNKALQDAYADGTYTALAAIHEDMSHRMHTIMGGGYIGGQRFLPWHRIYLLKMENLLRTKQWNVTIPYWNFTVDGARPDWVWRPPNVTRGSTGNGATLPSQATVDNLVNNTPQYGTFTNGVEFDAHNEVHNWSGGTLMNPMLSSRDPIFYLLHGNVDRIWDLWQAKHTGTPNLSGVDATMDPWSQTANDANSVVSLGYIYL